MLFLQLTKEAEAWLQKNGYTKSTIYHSFVCHWNKLRKNLGNDSEYSRQSTAGYCIQLFGKNLMEEAIPARNAYVCFRWSRFPMTIYSRTPFSS